jgi:aminopeptidase N
MTLASARAAVHWLVLVALAHAAPLHAATPAGFDFDSTPGALSKQVVPSHYAIELNLDPAADRFGGSARIDVRVRAEVPSIVLHAHNLEAAKVALRDARGTRELAVRADPASRTWRLEPRDGRPIAAGAQVLELSWRGAVQRTGQGLFIVEHTAAGQPSRMLATQFEPRHARSVFPCFDEPAFRATFALQVTAPSGLEVLSNTPVERAQRTGTATRWRFARTPSMPTYLFAVSVGRFERLQQTIDGVRVAIVTTAGKREHGRYALAAMRQLLPYFRRYFGIAYPLPKLDLLAVPGVRNGAMEDWGLVSFHESLLLVDPRDSAPQKREWVYGLIAHELAHQWFGNLVTAAWWDEIWLNEAFATWIAAKATARFNPGWKLAETRRLDRRDALQRDATEATRAIRSGPVQEDAVFDVFDEITYDKGGAVLAMLEDWLGPERFRAGLAAYMRERRYSNATAGDLWRHLGQAAGRDIDAVVASWTDQPGYPVLDAVRNCRDGQTALTLSQSPFTLSDFARAQTWKVPVRMRHGGQRRFVLLDGASATLRWPGCAAAPVVVNAGDIGFYRVRYAPDDAAARLERIGELPPADRLMLLDDAFAASQAGRQPIAPYLQALTRLPESGVDAMHGAALQAVQAIDFIDASLTGASTREPFAAFARSVLAPLLAALGWQARDRDGPSAMKLRGELITLLARLGDDDVRRRAAASVRAAFGGGPPLEPTIREAVLAAAGAGADRSMFDLLAGALRDATNDERRWELARAIGAVQSDALAAAALTLALDERLPAQIVGRIPSWLSDEGRQPGRAYEFALQNFDALSRRSADWGRAWILPGAAAGSSDAAAAARLIEHQRERVGASGAAAAAQVAAEIELKARFREREAAALARMLAGVQRYRATARAP